MGSRTKPSYHGLTGTRIYRIYRGIKVRCTNKSDDYHAKYYVNKGIYMCQEWYHDPMAFYKWAMKNGYKNNLTIERIDNNEGYTPENCRWATVKEQCNNRSTNVFITINGETKTIAQWSEKSGIHQSIIRRNLKAGRPPLQPGKFSTTKSKIAQYDLQGNLIKVWDNARRIGIELGIPNVSNILKVCKKMPNYNQAFNYGWSYYPNGIWEPSRLIKKPRSCKKIQIGKRSLTMAEWANLLKMSYDGFRHKYCELKNSKTKLLQYIKNKMEEI